MKTQAVNTARKFLIVLNNLLQIQKTAEKTGDLIVNKIVDKIIRVSKTLPHNDSKYLDKEKYLDKDIYLHN